MRRGHHLEPRVQGGRLPDASGTSDMGRAQQHRLQYSDQSYEYWFTE